MIVGGALNVALWPIYTSLHGPTSFDAHGELLGRGTEFWGSMMEGPSGLLIALGLVGSHTLLTGHAGRMARVGFVLAMIGALIPALVNTAILAVMPPLLAPVFGVGVILIAVANRTTSSLTRFSRLVLIALGMVLNFSFLWTLLVRPDVMDQIDGYRIYGVVANVLSGRGGLCSAPASARRGTGRRSWASPRSPSLPTRTGAESSSARKGAAACSRSVKRFDATVRDAALPTA